MKLAILTSYSTQIFTAIIGVVMMPVYLRYLGTETFGLIGFFTMLQTWLILFDFGLTPTLSRQMALYKAGVLSAQDLGKLLRTLEWFFTFLAVVTMLVGATAAAWLAVNWLKLDRLQPDMVALCIGMMAVISGLRWFSSLYRSGLIGLERQIMADGITAGVMTLKFIGVLPLLMFVSTKPTAFFGYQVFIAICEAFICWKVLHHCLGKAVKGARASLAVLKDILPFATNLAFSTAIWILIINLDKLLLSHFLSLQEYGYFTVALAIASGILMLTFPLSQVVQPRLTILFSQGENFTDHGLFREVSQFISGLMAAVSINIAVFSEQLLFAWTGNAEVSAHSAPILFWYALGNGIVGVLTLPYLVQHAIGNLRLHVIGNIIYGSIYIPTIIYGAWKFGAVGTGIIWFASNLLLLALWIPIIFQRYLKGVFLDWFIKDIVYIWGAAAIPFTLFSFLPPNYESKVLILMRLMLIGCLSLMLAWTAGNKTRARLLHFIKHRKI